MPRTLSEQWSGSLENFIDFGSIQSEDASKPLAMPLTPTGRSPVHLKLSKGATSSVIEPKIADRIQDPSAVRSSIFESGLYFQFENTFARADENGNLKWAVRSKAPMRGSFSRPVFAGPVVFVVFPQGKAVCLDRETGKMRWSHKLSEISESPQVALSGSTLLVSVRERGRSSVIALDVQDGETKWKSEFEAMAQVSSISGVEAGGFVIGLSSGEAVMLRDQDGGLVWRKDLVWKEPVRVIARGERIVAWTPKSFHVIDGENRAASLGGEEIKAASISQDHAVLMMGNGDFLGFDFRKRSSIWRRQAAGFIQTPHALRITTLDSEEGFWVAATNGKLLFLSLHTGKTLRELNSDAELRGTVLVGDQMIWAGLRDGFKFLRFQ